MSLLWCDKYRPKELSKLDFHKQQAENLKNLICEGDFPHLLVYGPSGAGKKTRIMCLLKELYGPGVERMRMEHMNFTTPSNKKLEIMTVSSNYHIEVNPSDVGMYDRVVIMDLIKNVAQSQQLDVGEQKEFKVVVLNGVDELTKDAQHALRRTMEKYVATCRLILCANSTSRVIPAIRSRCLSVRVPAPKREEIISILTTTSKKEGLNLPIQLANRITDKASGNLRRALLMLETCKIQVHPKDFNADQPVQEPDWQEFIREIARKITHEQSKSKLIEVRNDLYELLTTGIPSDIIFQTLLSELVKNCDIILKTKIVALAAEYEHRMQQGNKAIFHLEAFVARYMSTYQEFMDVSGFAFDD